MQSRIDRRPSYRPHLERIEDRVLPGEAFGLVPLFPTSLFPEAPGLASISQEEHHPASVISAISSGVDSKAPGDLATTLAIAYEPAFASLERALFQPSASAFHPDGLAPALAMPMDFHITGIVLDQSNVVPNFQFDAAVVSAQSVAQTFTVGVDGTLAQVDFQIYKNTGTTGDVVFDIRPTIKGVPDPDDGNILYETVISLDKMPTIDDPFMDVPLTSIDVSAGKLPVAAGDMLALSLSREGQGSPPWVLWRQGQPIYQGGSTYIRNDSTMDWRPLENDGGFQTWVLPS
jgi:hypothetical protein